MHYPGPTAENLAAIPAALLSRKQFVLWRGRARANQPGKIDKIPVNPYDLTNADTTDALTWGPFADCVAALATALEEWEQEDPAGYCGGGIGVVFTQNDPWTGVDLDDCVDESTKAIAPWAQEYVDRLQSYTEITPSLKGLRILTEADLPPGHNRKGQVEMYSHGRFFTLTGLHVAGTPTTIEARTIQLQGLWAQLFGPQVGDSVYCLDTHGSIQNATPLTIDGIELAPDGGIYARFAESQTGWPLVQCEAVQGATATLPPTAATAPMADLDVLTHVRMGHNGAKASALFTGNWQSLGYPSQSEADLAFCGFLCDHTQDPAQIDRILRMTPLYRTKWDRASYGQRTIMTAIQGHMPHAQLLVHNRPQSTGSAVPTNGNGAGQWGTSFDFSQGTDAQTLMRLHRVPPRFLIDKLVPDGLTILGAPAKSYKSYFALSLALATIGAGHWCDAFEINDPGNVVFFGLEAPLMQLRNRIHQLRPDFDPAQCPHTLTFFSGIKALPSFKQGLEDAVARIIDHYQPRLIVIDPLSYLYRLGKQDDLASATLDLLWPLAEMVFQAGVALFAAEHMRKRSKEDITVVDQLGGSYIKPCIVHGLLMMHRAGEDIIIETTMRDAPQQELALSLEFDNEAHQVTWGYKGSSTMLAATRQDDLKVKVYAQLQQNKYPQRTSEILEALSLPLTDRNKSTVRQILHRGEREKVLAVSRRGEYYWIGQ